MSDDKDERAKWRRLAEEAWRNPGWAEAAREYHANKSSSPRGKTAAEQRTRQNPNGRAAAEPPPVNGPDDHGGFDGAAYAQEIPHTAPPAAQKAAAPVLTLADWLARDLPDPDFILGSWLSTTSRVFLFSPTGLGKTMLLLAMAIAIANGTGFLHWTGPRPVRVLFIDGEMSRRLLRERLAEEVRRSGHQPDTLFVFSHEDIEGFAPLNTKEGQAIIEAIIKQCGGIDLIIFDNVMSLIAGDQKDEEGWRQTLPWIRALTRRGIGQIWLHHTGHDESHSYGTKTREWQMDTVIGLETIERPDTDVSFQLNFRKARERTPTTRADFTDTRIALVDNRWTSDAATTSIKAKVSPLGKKFFDALVNAAIDSDAKKMVNCPTATIEHWRIECIKIGLLDKDKPKSASALFSKHKRELIAADKVACNETMAWTLSN